MHFEAGDSNKKARAAELFFLVMIAQNVAYVLAKKTLDTLAELLNPVDVRLLDAPRFIGRDSLLEIELDSGECIHATPDHLFMRRDGRMAVCGRARGRAVRRAQLRRTGDR